MAEVYTWPEGSAYFWSGNSTTSALATYARNIAHTRRKVFTSYRAPHGATYSGYNYASAATLTIGQLYSQLNLVNYFEAAPVNGFHAHLMHSAGGIGQTGGVFLYSGTIHEVSLNGSDGQVFNHTFQAQFPTWSAY